VPSPAERLNELAEECRRLADSVHDQSVRRDLLLVAERFERLARVRRGRGTTERSRNIVC
jgi:hypothetical protein